MNITSPDRVKMGNDPTDGIEEDKRMPKPRGESSGANIRRPRVFCSSGNGHVSIIFIW